MVNNSTKNDIWPQLIADQKKDHDMWRWKSRSWLESWDTKKKKAWLNRLMEFKPSLLDDWISNSNTYRNLQ